jgi:hypothetical protein
MRGAHLFGIDAEWPLGNADLNAFSMVQKHHELLVCFRQGSTTPVLRTTT